MQPIETIRCRKTNHNPYSYPRFAGCYAVRYAYDSQPARVNRK